MSLNLRFGRNRYGRFFCADNFHRDYFIQNFGALLGDTRLCRGKLRPGINALVQEYARPCSTLEIKIRTIRAVLRQLCVQFCPRAAVETLYPADAEDQQIGDILRDLEGKLPYLSVEEATRSRPVGPVSPRQRNLVQEKARACGYSPEVLRHILYNRVGKTGVDQLSRTEAAQMLLYMNTPGAVW